MDKKYLYILKYKQEESAMCQMEMKYLFNEVGKQKYFITTLKIEVTRSIFTKACLEILLCADTFFLLLEHVREACFNFDKYKVEYIDNENFAMPFKEGLKKASAIGYEIEGDFEMQAPLITLGITKLEDKWYFGILKKNTQAYHKHDDKPMTFSNSLPLRVAHTLVNIAMGNNFNQSIVDPCCGVGTVILEAKGMGINIDAYDLSFPTAMKAQANLDYYHYDLKVKKSDIKDIDKYYDVAIIDLPYGLFTVITKGQQMDILKNAYRISDKLVLVSNVDMRKDLLALKYKDIDESYVIKQQFKRFIYVAFK